MRISELFSEAEGIIAEETQRNKEPDLLRQYEIIRTRKWPKQTKEHQVLNNLAMAAASYSAVRKTFKVLYPEDIFRFDGHYSACHFRNCTEPLYSYDDWARITLSWGNMILEEIGIPKQDSLLNFVGKLKLAKSNEWKSFSKQHRPRLVLSLATALPKVKREILVDPESFWIKFDKTSRQHPGKAFDCAKEFSVGIIEMGTPLICNFFKELGLLYYVKTDVHLGNFLKQLASSCKRLGEKEQFILTWLLARETGLEPFFLDKILYVGGKYAKAKMTLLFERHHSEYLAIVERLVLQIPAFL
ncbi:MAG: hypothetical protein Q8M92_08565 [Candidatus Subteraquimicrobiales bacterium]|nr:hypothetical protein [Candidatus Subteraquimicrobiales bacterium]